MVPMKRLFERSSVRSFESLPSSAGIGPVMLLFCNNLKIKKIKKKINQLRFKTTYILTEKQNYYLHYLKICQIANAWG